MAKRFTDTELWEKEWFMELSCKEKCLVRYLFDRCDCCGVWKPNWKLASNYIGEEVTEKDLEKFSDRIEWFDTKIFIPDFIEFQYGKLSENCKPHISIINRLKKYGLYERVAKGLAKGRLRVGEGLAKGMDTLQEKEKEKEIQKGGVGENEIEESKPVNGFHKPKSDFRVQMDLELPIFALEAAEMNQYTWTGQRNTEFIQRQWKVFLKERMGDPENKQALLKDDLPRYFLNWVRNKIPKNHSPTEKNFTAAPPLKRLN